MRIVLLILGFTTLLGCKKETVDSRDKITGKYICSFKHYNWQVNDSITKVIIQLDTLVVSKKSETEIEILPQAFGNIPNSFKLDANYSYSWASDGTNSLTVQFFPDKDSISYFVSSGGLGGGSKNQYNGKKNINK